ncbi:MAG: UDP-N-acetylglucosamine 2-epimerase [Tepidisphaeraceae bacterium]
MSDPPGKNRKLSVCFVTGTRAEFGLMRTTLRAIQAHPKLQLQLLVTGMHLHARHGRSIDVVRDEGWKIDAVVPWKLAGHKPSVHAKQTGLAMAGLASAFSSLASDVVLVVGDRVEAFAAAGAAHLSHRAVAHVHGGDRAVGQVDDSLRHAITKLAHVHFPATAQSAARILRLGEDRWRVHRVGSPGIDGIVPDAAAPARMRERFPKLAARRYALIVLHPVVSSGKVEYGRADELLSAVQDAGIEQTVVIYPNNDPGSHNIIACWERRRRQITYLLRDVSRDVFLGLLHDAAVLVGNSSSGIIEAASFGMPVVDVGPRQLGRERGENVTAVPYGKEPVRRAVAKIWNDGRATRFPRRNVYEGSGTGRKIADALARLRIDERLLRKRIDY